MWQDKFSGKAFEPNRTKKNIRIIYWVCGSFILLGFILSGGEIFSAGALFAGFGVAMLCIGHFLTTPSRVSYCINSSGVSLNSRKHSLKISFSEIESILELKENQAEELMLRLKKKEESEAANIVFGENGRELTVSQKIMEAFRLQAKALAPYKFLSVPVMYKSTGGDKQTKSSNLPCDTVFLLLKNGEGYLISPLDTAGFVMEAKKFMQLKI